MKKVFLLFFIALLLPTNLALAEDDLWDNFGDQNIYGQTPVTDEEFEKALESKKGKPKKPKDKLLRDGEAFQESNETQTLTKMTEELPILLVPLNLELKDGVILPVGHYQLKGVKKGDKFYLQLFQSNELFANIEAVETRDDFGEEKINFARLIDDNGAQVKIIFGSIDFNAYAIVKIAQ